MAKFLKVRNWDRWQSYRSDRGQPPWIKLHRSLLKDWDFMSLSDSERGQLMCLWILAAERNGLVPDDELALRKLLLTSDSIPLAKFLSLQFLEKTTKRRRQPDASLASQLSEDKNRTPPIVPPHGGRSASQRKDLQRPSRAGDRAFEFQSRKDVPNLSPKRETHCRRRAGGGPAETRVCRARLPDRDCPKMW